MGSAYIYLWLARESLLNLIMTINDHLHYDVTLMTITQLKEGTTELKLELVDVGGQRGERRRWIHCFEGVDAGAHSELIKTDIPNTHPSFPNI